MIFILVPGEGRTTEILLLTVLSIVVLKWNVSQEKLLMPREQEERKYVLLIRRMCLKHPDCGEKWCRKLLRNILMLKWNTSSWMRVRCY